MTTERVHSNRARAESFGARAQRYDAERPRYPDALMADLLAGAPASVLDVGCGTGIAARLVAARGVPVLGVEIDPRMAEVARGTGLAVEVGAFETWPDAGRRFDLLTCAQAWHWVDPVAGPVKAARLLNPGGRLALFWNYAEHGQPLNDRLQAVYREHAPSLVHSVANSAGRAGLDGHVDSLDASGRFEPVRRTTYPWVTTRTGPQWIRLISTHSDHALLPPGQFDALARAVLEAIDACGGTVVTRYDTHLLTAAVAA